MPRLVAGRPLLLPKRRPAPALAKYDETRTLAKVMEPLSKKSGFVPISWVALEVFKSRPEHLLAYVNLESTRNINTGNINFNISLLALRWGWSRHKVRDFLEEARQLLANPLGAKGQQKGQQKGHPTAEDEACLEQPLLPFSGSSKILVESNKGQQKGQHNNKEVTTRKTITTTTTTPPPENPGGISYSENFLIFWLHFPKGRRIEKQKAFKAWTKQKCEELHLEGILEGLRIWNLYWQGSELKFIPWPSTFLNGRRWENTPEGKNIIMGDRQHVPAPSPEADAVLKQYEELER